jgi:dihydrofolate reductase
MLSISVAVANNNIIGGNNQLLWNIPQDLKRFKKNTINKTIIMGRKTFESLPGILPQRMHIVLTKDTTYKIDSKNVLIVHSLDEILTSYYNSKEEAFIIGGGQLYNSTIDYCNKIYLTKIYKDFNGDTYFPTISYSNWDIAYSSNIKTNPNDGLNFRYIDLIKKANV